MRLLTAVSLVRVQQGEPEKHHRMVVFFVMDFSQCDSEAGAQKTTRYAGGDNELYKRNHLSDNIEVLKLLCQKGKVIPWLNRETV